MVQTLGIILNKERMAARRDVSQKSTENQEESQCRTLIARLVEHTKKRST